MLKHRITIVVMVLAVNYCTYASSPYLAEWKERPFYFGPLIGYGSTDWSMLALHCNGNDFCRQAVSESAPISAGDTGLVWGATIGYEVKPSWAIESTFMRYPNTTVLFDPLANFYLDNYNLSTLRTTTWALIGVAKFMTQIADTGWRGFANAGIGFTFRDDVITNAVRINPTFGVGVNHLFPQNVMLEFSFQYIPGFGEANHMPAIQYMPFLYSLNAKLVYRL